jgi:hypothetical protein
MRVFYVHDPSVPCCTPSQKLGIGIEIFGIERRTIVNLKLVVGTIHVYRNTSVGPKNGRDHPSFEITIAVQSHDFK